MMGSPLSSRLPKPARWRQMGHLVGAEGLMLLVVAAAWSGGLVQVCSST